MSVGLTQNAFTDKNILYKYQQLEIDDDKVVTFYFSLSNDYRNRKLEIDFMSVYFNIYGYCKNYVPLNFELKINIL